MNKTYSATHELEYALRLLETPAGLWMAGAGVALFLLSFSRRGRRIVICLMLFISMFGFDRHDLRDVTLIPVLDTLRFAAQPLTMLLLMFLLIPSLFGNRKKTGVLGATFAFFLVEFIFALHTAISADVVRGLLAMVIYPMILVSMGVGLARSLETIDDVYSALRCVACAGALFVVSTSLQLTINPSAIISNQRLYAITGNPQHAAVILSTCLVPVCYLLASPRERLPLRIAWGAVAALMIVMLIWTGSRAGVLGALVCLGLLFRHRIGRFLGAGIVVTAFVFAFLSMFQDVDRGGMHLLNTTDTRTQVWLSQLEIFKSNIFFGDMSPKNWGPRESSYLSVASNCGLVGLAPLVLFLVLVARTLLKLGRLRAVAQSPQNTGLIDLATAGIISILVESVFEGILLGILTFMVLAVYFYLAVMKFLVDFSAAERLAQAPSYDRAAMDDQWGLAGAEQTPYDELPDPYFNHGGRAF